MVEFQGVVGEYALAKMLLLPTSQLGHADGRPHPCNNNEEWDLCGFIDAKTTETEMMRVCAKGKEQRFAPVYVLMRVPLGFEKQTEELRVVYSGCTTPPQLKTNDNLTKCQSSTKMVYMMHLSQLTPTLCLRLASDRRAYVSPTPIPPKRQNCDCESCLAYYAAASPPPQPPGQQAAERDGHGETTENNRSNEGVASLSFGGGGGGGP